MEELIHMTATYSNALLVAILPHITEVSKKLDLPIVQPVTPAHVQRFNPNPYKGHYSGSVVLKDRHWFLFDEGGYVASFTSPTNWFSANEDAVEHTEWFIGETTMSNDEIIALARTTLEKLGYPPNITGADQHPEVQGPSNLKDGRHVPYSRIEWQLYKGNENRYEKARVEINTQHKKVVGFYLVLPKTNEITSPLKLDIEPETQAEFRTRNKKIPFVRTNAPPRLPQSSQ